MKSTAAVVGVALIAMLVLLLVGGAGMIAGYGFNPFGALLRLVFPVLIIGGFVLVSVWIVRNANRGGMFAGSSESPLDIAKLRYAKGEIRKEQLDTIKRDLGA